MRYIALRRIARNDMLAKRIIPCLDVNAGRVVKGVNFVSLRDAGDPVEIARRYDAEGADELTFLDITASSDQRDIIVEVIEAVANQVFIPLTVGGACARLTTCGGCCSRGPTRFRSTRLRYRLRDSSLTPAPALARSASWLPSTRAVASIPSQTAADGRMRRAGRFTRTAVALPPDSMQLTGHVRS